MVASLVCKLTEAGYIRSKTARVRILNYHPIIKERLIVQQINNLEKKSLPVNSALINI